MYQLRVGFAVPVVGAVDGEAFINHLTTLAEVVRKTSEVAVFRSVNRVPHDSARTAVLEEAIRTNCDYLFFVDADTLVPRGGYVELMDTMLSQKPAVISGHYYRRGWPYTCVWSKKLDDPELTKGSCNQDGWFQVDADAGVHEIDVTGLGCALIDISFVRDKLKPPYFTMLKDDKGVTMVTDDVSFYDLIRAAGGKILGNANVRCAHQGSHQIITRETVDTLRAMHIAAHPEEVRPKT
jgi:hypothetical protein